MTQRMFRNKVSGNIYAEFANGSSQTNFPKDWEEVFPEPVEPVGPEKTSVKTKPKGK